VDDIEALQAHLDRVPDDHTVRLVLADRLEEAGSPLAEGYRALALLERVPRARSRFDEPQLLRWQYVSDSNIYARYDAVRDLFNQPLHTFALADDWVRLMKSSRRMPGTNFEAGWREWPTRKAAECAAAMAFARLPESRRRELLAKLYGVA